MGTIENTERVLISLTYMEAVHNKDTATMQDVLDTADAFDLVMGLTKANLLMMKLLTDSSEEVTECIRMSRERILHLISSEEL